MHAARDEVGWRLSTRRTEVAARGTWNVDGGDPNAGVDGDRTETIAADDSRGAFLDGSKDDGPGEPALQGN
jgi:hypothetical protein